jgi:hypothetical protein
VQGSSALAATLLELPQPMTIFAVWQPVLTQAGPPSAELQAVLSDPRVLQLWDPDHLLSDEIGRAERAHPGSLSTAHLRTDEREDGILYDTVVLYADGARWQETLPAPDWLDGGLEAVLPALAERLCRDGLRNGDGSGAFQVSPYPRRFDHMRNIDSTSCQDASDASSGIWLPNRGS